MYVMVGIIRST